MLIDRNYAAFTDSCMRRAEGDQQKADYLFNCSYWEYYYRMMSHNQYVEWHNEQAKKAMNSK